MSTYMIVIIDNYDSFTYNLVQYYKQIDSEVLVKRNDEWQIEEIFSLRPDLIVLSPGPGRPVESGICKEVLNVFGGELPILGICLGHQLIVEHFGGVVEKGLRPVHGKVTTIVNDGRTLFRSLPAKLRVTRYHSLQAERQSLPEQLEMTGVSEDDVIMGVRHRTKMIEGIQFHPESILTDYGFEMLKNHYTHVLRFRENRKVAVKS